MLKRLWNRLASIPRPNLRGVREFLSNHREGIGTWSVRVAAVGSLALIVLLIHRSVYTFLTGQPSFQLKQQIAKIDITPRWADPRTGEGTVHLKVDGETWNLFDESLVARVGKAFEENPWIRRVTKVERLYPDSVRVQYETRRPYAAVARANGLYLIDRDAVRLPGVYADAPPCETSVRFSGLVSQPPPPGRKWEGAEIAAVLEMAELMAREPLFKKAGVTAVDLANLGARLDRRRAEIALVTSGGCTIEWGRVPSSNRVGETPLAEKLAGLRQVLEAWPNLEGRLAVKLHVTPRGQFPATVPREAQIGGTPIRRQ